MKRISYRCRLLVGLKKLCSCAVPAAGRAFTGAGVGGCRPAASGAGQNQAQAIALLEELGTHIWQ